MTAPLPPGRPIGRSRRKTIGEQSRSPSAGPRPTAPWELELARDEPLDPDVLIRTRGLTKHYGDLVAVDHLDLDIRRGEIYGLLGPNGAGKTTTILMLLGLSEPTEGEALVVGFDPTRHPLEVKRSVGYLPDNAGFYGAMSGRANLAYTAALNGMRGKAAVHRIEEVLEQVGLTDAADRRAETYSRGMRQRLGIADALIKEPSVLILDEPTIAIDPQGVVEILGLVRRLVHERGLALLLSSHLLEQVQSICDRVGIFVRGRLVAQGPVDELARSLGHGRVLIEVGLAPDGGAVDQGRVETLLRGVDGVDGVATEGLRIGTWRIDASRDVRAGIAAAVESAGLPLVHLRRVDAGLDEVYRRYAAADEEAADDRRD